MSSLSFLIRDALPDDLDSCLALDHGYETDQVWQMTVENQSSGWRVLFRTERLPRTIDVETRPELAHLSRFLEVGQGAFLACGKDDETLLGYAMASLDPIDRHTTLHELVVDRPYRRRKIGTRLLNVVRRWAMEQGSRQLYIHTQTKNVPSIIFCQRLGLSFCGYNDQYFHSGDIAVSFGQSLR